ncbi:MAG: hypothetical protein ACYTG0_38265 [Planctomycetota bacterium]
MCHTTSDRYHRLLKRHGWSIGDVAFRDQDTGRTTWLVTGSRGEHVITCRARRVLVMPGQSPRHVSLKRASQCPLNGILAVRLATTDLAATHGIERARRTVCLDFDGVIHSYSSGWCGADVIPDPPVHGARDAIARLRRQFKVVVLSSRCRTAEGREAVEAWLRRHSIEVDEVCSHKPPAMVYVDDRAVRFRGDWDDTIGEIVQFRRCCRS